MSLEEVERKHVALEAIAGTAGGHQVARVVCPAAGQRDHVVERGIPLIETRRTVHTALAAVAQRHPAHGLFRGDIRRDAWPK